MKKSTGKQQERGGDKRTRRKKEGSEDSGEQQYWLAPDTICEQANRNGADPRTDSRHSAKNTDEIGTVAQTMHIVIERQFGDAKLKSLARSKKEARIDICGVMQRRGYQ